MDGGVGETGGNLIRLSLPYPPTANLYWRLMRGRIVKSTEARDYQKRVRWLALAAKVRPIDGPVVVTVVAYRPRRVGDLDNTLKVVIDALKGVAWHDDSQLAEIRATRLEDPADPRLVLTAEPQEPQSEAADRPNPRTRKRKPKQMELEVEVEHDAGK